MKAGGAAALAGVGPHARGEEEVWCVGGLGWAKGDWLKGRAADAAASAASWFWRCVCVCVV